MNKNLLLTIIAIVFFLGGVTFLVLSFLNIWKLSLAFALGCTGVANVILFIVNLDKLKKTQK